MVKTYLALDLELFWDEHLYETHREMDRKSDRRATAVKRVMAASVFEFSVDEEGRVSTGEVASWTERDWGDEQAVIGQLFNFLRARADTPVLTFGGLATDIPVLVLAAMGNGVSLPPQLLDMPGRKGPRAHLDLGLMLKGGGRTWSHLSQVLLRLGVPAELVSAKAHVARPSNEEQWQSLRDHVELDCLLLAISKVSWLTAQGMEALRFEPAVIALVAGFLRRRQDHAMAQSLHAYASELEGRLAERWVAAVRDTAPSSSG